MKRISHIAIFFFMLTIFPVFSQNPPDPPDHGTAGGLVGSTSGAEVPIEDGVIWLFLLLIAYAMVKIWKGRKITVMMNKTNE